MERGYTERVCESVRRVLAGIARRSFRDCMIGVLQRYRWDATCAHDRWRVGIFPISVRDSCIHRVSSY